VSLEETGKFDAKGEVREYARLSMNCIL